MLALSRKSILAIEAVVDIAHHGRAAPVSSRDFAERMGISRRHLEPVLQALVRGGVLKSIRGPKGGYVLARERRRISLGDIVREASAMGDGAENPDTALATAIIAPVLDHAFAVAMERLEETTLADVMAQAEKASLLPELKTSDFTI